MLKRHSCSVVRMFMTMPHLFWSFHESRWGLDQSRWSANDLLFLLRLSDFSIAASTILVIRVS